MPRLRAWQSHTCFRCCSWLLCRGPKATLEEAVTQLQQLMAGIGADKTDVVAGLACAALLQDEAALAAAPGPAGCPQGGGAEAGARGKEAAPAAVALKAASVAGGSTAGSKVDASGKASSRADSSTADPELLAWAAGVCCEIGRAHV